MKREKITTQEDGKMERKQEIKLNIHDTLDYTGEYVETCGECECV